ncbi:MAG: 2Fe-2S iron-sulfur cluster binding domain-containing protein [Tissierellia bacterium]|nr:2Fe-2S iron-sulfur cluster binding domain-containing protein [Tissierellia bacterium]
MTILTTVVIVSLISGVLALILTFADKYIADYGEVQLTINDDKKFTVEGGKSLLSTLMNEKIFIPSACGGKGTCGYCKVKVLEGGGPVLATELPWLTKEELENHVRLSCQCKVKQDIQINIPEELFNVKEYDVIVEKITEVTPTIKRVRFKLPEGEHLNFKPGQYVQIKAPMYDGNDEEVFRAYSIASSATDSGYVELFIGFTGGIATTYVHKFLNEGDVVNLNGPYGDFYYKDDDGGPILMVAAGTGMAPILSILHHMRDNDIQREAKFFFGAKTPDDLFVVDELEQFEKDLSNFQFLPTLSRVTDEMGWTGDVGRVNNSIDKYVEQGGNYTAYLCGSPVMIDSIVESLKEKEIPEENIYFDKF